MGRKGEARRALGAAFTAGILGSIIGTFTLAAAIPVAKVLVLLLGSPELFVITLWGVSMVSILAGPRPLKGLIAGAFGLVLSVVGIQAQSGVMRFVFGEPYFLEGLPLGIMALAVFGIPSSLDLAITRVGVEKPPVELKGSLLEGIQDAFRNKWLVVHCSFVGIWVEIIPGLGAQVVDWLSYGHAAQTCKGAKETFGKGDVRGVIAPESSNDAKDGGTLIPTLTLGILGSLTSALFLFALITMGFSPGPYMLERNADLVYSIVWVLGVASIIGGAIGLIFANPLAKLAELRYSIIVPMILMFVLIGALSATRHPLDLLMVFSFGVIGYIMKRFSYPRPPLILGMILGLLMEKYLYISTARYEFAWLQRPAVIILLVLVFTSLGYTLWSRREKKEEGGATTEDTAYRIQWRFSYEAALTLAFVVLFVGVIIEGRSWPFIAELMPVYVAAIPGVLLASVQLYRDVAGWELRVAGRGVEMDETAMGSELDRRTEIIRTLTFFAWFGGAALLTWLLGIRTSLPLFVFFYTLIDGGEKWWMSLAMAFGAWILVWGLFEGVFDVLWPPGLLFE